ncbi:hypothetical protein ACHAXT_003735 [Thalassiosira profunda]
MEAKADALEARKAALLAKARKTLALQPLSGNSNASIAEQQEKASLARAKAKRESLLALRASVATPTNRPNGGLAVTKRPLSPMEEGQIAEPNKVPRRRLEPRVIHNSEPPSLLRQCGNRVDDRGYHISPSSAEGELDSSDLELFTQRIEAEIAAVKGALGWEAESETESATSVGRASEPAPDPARSTSNRASSKPTHRKREALRRKNRMPAYNEAGQALLRWLRDELLSPPQALEAANEVTTSHQSKLNLFEGVVDFGLKTLDEVRLDTISQTEFGERFRAYRTRLGDVICGAKDGKYKRTCNLTMYGMLGSIGNASVLANYATEDDLNRQSDDDRLERNLSLPHTPCFLPYSQMFPRKFLHDVTGVESDVVADELAFGDIALFAFTVDGTTSSEKAKSYWEKMDGFAEDMEVSRGMIILAAGILLYLQAASYRFEHSKAMPLLCKSSTAELEMLNCAVPQITALLDYPGPVLHGSNLLDGLNVFYPDEEKDRMDDVVSYFYPRACPGLKLSLNFHTNVYRVWNTKGMSEARVKELLQAKREGTLKGLRNGRETQAKIRARVAGDEGSADDLAFVANERERLREMRARHSEETRAKLSKAATDFYMKTWMAKLEKLRFFHKKHGHCRVSEASNEQRAAEWAKLPGWSQALAKWVSLQRKRRKGDCNGCKKLTDEQVALLDALGFDWETGRRNG